MEAENKEKFIKDYLAEYQFSENPACFEDGCILNGCVQMHKATGEEEYLRIVHEYLQNYIHEDGTVEAAGSKQLNIDSVNTLKVLFYIYDITRKEKYLRAIETIQDGIRMFPRNADRIFMVDENREQTETKFLYEVLPFYMEYETRFHKKAEYNDIIRQFESGRGKKPEEWYLMALIDAMDVMSIEIFEHYKTLEKLFKEKIKNYMGNGSAYIRAYVIIKACKNRVLLREKYERTGVDILEGEISKLLSETGESVTPEHMGILMMAYAQNVMLQKQ